MATRKRDRRREALKLVSRLLKLHPDQALANKAQQLHDRLKLPMTVVCDKVPGDSVVQKAAKCGVSRQAFHAWLRGHSRPNEQQSKLLAKITGFDADEIRGRRQAPPPPARRQSGASRSA